MKQILWFRRDLRIEDSALLENAQGEVFPIFIFDIDILDSLPFDDKRVNFIYQSVIDLKQKLLKMNLDLAIFYGKPKEIFKNLKKFGFDEVLCSVDFDFYSKKRDDEIDKIIPLRQFIDSFILNPANHLKNDGTPYKVFTPFYKSLDLLTNSNNIEQRSISKNMVLFHYDYTDVPTLESMGFKLVNLPKILTNGVKELLEKIPMKLSTYKENRDYFYKDATSNLSVFLRFGIISPVMVFNYVRNLKDSDFFIRELFWREFYNYILFHFPNSEFNNFNNIDISWNENEDDFIRWCEGNTGVPIIDAAMRHLNRTGFMHNRLRMIVASFLTKNLFIDWKKGEKYFALKLLDYEASSNIGSWQWGASTGADAAPYFRVFNPYTQSKKFDEKGIFIKSVIKELKDVDSRLFHIENGVQSNLFISYPKAMVDISISRKRAIEKFKEAKNETV
ncbi:deoxyribodipyrimidine photo-lyase [Halarcobacter sp.]|uniref:cryptochrome/photolyase family protein n=1 Tax=Halarcobacter sp. TaxID=2321133 RepID=UPI002AA8E547|nr:deoxyribodipyrimidine photo-lyase [Halarcobacter sp.]